MRCGAMRPGHRSATVPSPRQAGYDVVLRCSYDRRDSRAAGVAAARACNLWSPIMRLDAIAIGQNPPEDVNVVIEVPIGGEPIKYEMDKAAGTLVVDRFLHTAMRYPGNYGFVPHTLSEDGDPIDVLIANTRPIVPGAIINVRPVGVLKMQDDAGGDEKIIAVPVPKLTKRYAHISEYSQMPEITIQQIQHFFEHYKDLEPGKWVKVIGWGGAAEARRLIADAISRAKQKG
jgi:inorganic pyrophosphatase